MKNLITICFALFISINAFSQNAIDRFFTKYENDPEFSVVYVSPKMFKMVSKVAGEEFDQEMGDVVKSLKGLTVLSTEKNGQQFYKEAIGKIPVSEYDELVKVRDKGENVKIMTKSSNNDDIVHELLILVGGETDFTLVSFVGDIRLDQISKLAKNLDIKGAEHLDKVND